MAGHRAPVAFLHGPSFRPRLAGLWVGPRSRRDVRTARVDEVGYAHGP